MNEEELEQLPGQEEAPEENFKDYLKNKKQKDYAVLFDYAMDVLTYSNQVHLYHWTCGKGFWHTQMEEIYDSLRDFADAIVETTLSKDVDFAISSKKYELEDYSFDDKKAISSLEDFKDATEKVAIQFDGDRGITNLFDDFIADLEKHIGLLKNFA